MFKRKPPTTPKESEVAMISWAEIVPDAPYPMSAEEFDRLLDDGWQYELIRGRLVRMPGNMGNSTIAMRLGGRLSAYVEPRGLGYVGGGDGFFRFTLPDETKLNTAAPNVSFTQSARAPQPGTRAFYQPWLLVPDLAVEIASPHQNLADKITLWLAAGVQLLWVIYPQERRMQVWRPGESAPSLILGMADTLDALEVVPGFRLPVRDLLV